MSVEILPTAALHYDTIRYTYVLSKAHGSASLIRRMAPKTKNKEKTCKNENRVAHKKRPGVIVREGSPGRRSENTGKGFVKQVLSRE